MYLKGIVKALKGQYPYEQLEQLAKIKKTINQDFQETFSDAGAASVVRRYQPLTEKSWESVYTLSSAAFGKSLQKMGEREDTQPVKDVDLEHYRDPYSIFAFQADDEDQSFH